MNIPIRNLRGYYMGLTELRRRRAISDELQNRHRTGEES
jgi:hypothetical protein